MLHQVAGRIHWSVRRANVVVDSEDLSLLLDSSRQRANQHRHLQGTGRGRTKVGN